MTNTFTTTFFPKQTPDIKICQRGINSSTPPSLAAILAWGPLFLKVSYLLIEWGTEQYDGAIHFF